MPRSCGPQGESYVQGGPQRHPRYFFLRAFEMALRDCPSDRDHQRSIFQAPSVNLRNRPPLPPHPPAGGEVWRTGVLCVLPSAALGHIDAKDTGGPCSLCSMPRGALRSGADTPVRVAPPPPLRTRTAASRHAAVRKSDECLALYVPC